MQTTPGADRGRCGNNTLRIVAILDSIRPGTRRKVHTPSPIERVLEAGIAEIEEARAARARAVTEHDRWYYRRVAEDVANHLVDNVLRMRRKMDPEPPGRPVPPTMGCLRRALELQRQLTVARAEVRHRDLLLHAAWAVPDDYAVWCKWELRMSELADAERELAALERKAAPWN